MGSLVKFMTQNENGHENGNGRGPVYWGRADIDGAPFRGSIPPNMTADEFDQRLTRVGDPKNGIFDLSDAKQNQQYLEVMNKAVNGWAQIMHVDRQYDKQSRTWLAYVEWVVFFMEDGKPMLSQQLEAEG